MKEEEYAQLLRRAHDLGIIAIGGAIINPDILQDAIASTEKIYADSEFQRLAESLPPVTSQKRLSRCTIDADPTLLRDVVEALEQHPLDFKAIAKEMDELSQNHTR